MTVRNSILALDHALALRLLAGRVFDFTAELIEGVCAKSVLVELQVVALERLKVALEVGLLCDALWPRPTYTSRGEKLQTPVIFILYQNLTRHSWRMRQSRAMSLLLK